MIASHTPKTVDPRGSSHELSTVRKTPPCTDPPARSRRCSHKEAEQRVAHHRAKPRWPKRLNAAVEYGVQIWPGIERDPGSEAGEQVHCHFLARPSNSPSGYAAVLRVARWVSVWLLYLQVPRTSTHFAPRVWLRARNVAGAPQHAGQPGRCRRGCRDAREETEVPRAPSCPGVPALR